MKKVLVLQNSVSKPSALLHQLECNGYLPLSSPFPLINILEQIKAKQYDVVLLNITEGVIRDIGKNQALCVISNILPLIFVTPSIDDNLLESLGKIHVYGCLVPPFSDEQLCSTIELACYNHKLSHKCLTDSEKAEVESEINYEVLLSNLPGMAYRCDNDRDWTMRFVSEGCYRLTGNESEAIINSKDLSFNDLITSENRERIWKKWQAALAEKEIFQDEYAITTATGEIKWVWEQGKGIYDDNGNIIAIEGFITDITEKKKVEEALRESESRYHSLFENTHSAMLILDHETGAIIDANPAAVSFYGWAHEELRCKNIAEINALPPSEVKEKLDCATKHQINHFFFSHRLADGSVRDVEVFSSPIIMKGKTGSVEMLI